MKVLTIDGRTRLSSTVSKTVVGVEEGILIDSLSDESSFSASAGLK